jgi:putative transcriptional regulator
MAYFPGQLLLATPQLLSPHFARTVILLLDHDEDGALGVVINRPSELPVQAVLPGWAQAVTEPQLLFAGGPVAPDSALALALCIGTGPSVGFKRLIGDYGLVDLDSEPDVVLPDLAGVRIFSGYAGWGAGQLEEEIEEGSWYVVSALPSDLLHHQPDQLWRVVLRRQPGELAYVANYPADPTMN